MQTKHTLRSFFYKYNTAEAPRWLRRTARVFSGLIVLLILSYVTMAWYVNNNKAEILKSVTDQLNENLSGQLTIGTMEPAFLTGFPLLSLNLKNVTIRDSLYPRHRQLFLNAGDFDIAVNAMALFRGAVEIKRISIANASINVYTDASGYSNASVFKKKPGTASSESEGGYPEIRRFDLSEVDFVVNNVHKNKLFKFRINNMKGDMDYTNNGWIADVRLETLVNSMAFSTKKGSFALNKEVSGRLKVSLDQTTEIIAIPPANLDIGSEEFIVSAKFGSVDNPSLFAIHINNEKIKWKNASELLSPNISSRLDMFDLEKPIWVNCDIIGDTNIAGDPLISVKAIIKDNVLHTTGGTVTNCNFVGTFTNNYFPDQGFNDINSAITFRNFTGKYADIPFVTKHAYILNLEEPIAAGDFASDFDIEKLNNIIDDDLVGFTKGKASINLKYRGDIVNYKLAKPFVEGEISISGADVSYRPRNLDFKNISVKLDFKDDNLAIGNIHLQTGKSVVDMKGNIDNFLNLYYTAPEKIMLNWTVTSPQLHLGEFIGFLGTRKKSAVVKKQKAPGNFTEEIDLLFDKSNVNMKVNVAKIYYGKFYATNATAGLLLTDAGLSIKNAGLNHAGGTVNLNGTLLPRGKDNQYNMNASVKNVDISRFFAAFNNFGLTSLTAKNLKGKLTSNAKLSGRINDSGQMVPKTMLGTINFNLRQGALVNFEPVKNVGKFAFPFRDMNKISIHDLKGNLAIKGDFITIQPMQVNSSILNMDIAGVYSFGAGTEIYVAVPLRNPKKDSEITDAEELAKRRMRGVVINLVAKDDEDGKVKLSLGKRKEN